MRQSLWRAQGKQIKAILTSQADILQAKEVAADFNAKFTGSVRWWISETNQVLAYAPAILVGLL